MYCLGVSLESVAPLLSYSALRGFDNKVIYFAVFVFCLLLSEQMQHLRPQREEEEKKSPALGNRFGH